LRTVDVIFASGEYVHFVAAMKCDLNNDMRRTAESDQKQSAVLRHGGFVERAIADQTSTKKWRDMFVVEIARQLIGEILRHDSVVGVSAMGIVTGIARARTKILLFTAAKAAGTVHVPKPGNSDPLATAKLGDTGSDFVDSADDLVTRNERGSMEGEVAFDDMDIGPANGAHVHLDSNFARSRLGLIDFLQNQRRFAHRFLIGQDHRSHRVKKG
jgi:hypothetical protein